MVVAKAAMPLFWAALFVGSGWMAVQSYRELPARAPVLTQGAGLPVGSPWLDPKWFRDAVAHAAATTRPSGDPPECRIAAADFVEPSEEEIGSYPIPAYRQFPPDLRALMRQEHVEHRRCRGGLGDRPETYRACNRRDCVTFELEKRGWCSDGQGSGAVRSWTSCSNLPDHTPLDRQVSYPEEEIRRMFPPEATPLDAAFSNAEWQFFGAIGDALPPDNPLARMRRGAAARLAACPGDPCRRQVEADMLNRLGFARDLERARGEAGAPVPLVPLRSGILHVDGDAQQMGVSLLPLGGDEILLQVAHDLTVQNRRRCHSLVAHGRIGPDGVAQLTTLDERGLRFTLRFVSPTQVELRPTGGRMQSPPPLCEQGDTIFRRYEALAPLR
jgi:hypothetical protein